MRRRTGRGSREDAANPATMGDVSYAAGRTPLELGVLATLVTLAFAAVVGFIAVLDAENVAAGFGAGLGIAFVIFLAGATIACALACLKRRRAEIASLTSIVVSGLAIDMLVLAVWLEIDDETYAKTAGIAFVWSFYSLVILGLTIAVGSVERLAWSLYLGALLATVLAGVISTWLVATGGGDDGAAEDFSDGDPFGVPVGAIGDDDLLRALGAVLVLLAALWFAALAASKLTRASTDVTR
jgi:hypothetical protein